MASLHLPPSTGSASDSNSNPRYTPVSNSDEDTPSKPGKSPGGQLKLQTDFGDSVEVGGPVEEGDEENGYESGEELEGKRTRTAAAPKYTLEEEREVVRSFDRRLVPFLALLYLLSFLDRSSMLSYSSYLTRADPRSQILEMPKLLDWRMISSSRLRSMNGCSRLSTSHTSSSSG
jgi:hypothetical protein